MKYLTITIFLLALLLGIAVAQQSNGSTNNEAQPSRMPNWTLYTQKGEKLSSSDYAGKPLILHFWGTWCPHCKNLQPGLERLRVKFEPEGLEVLAISVKEPDGSDPQAVLDSRGIKIKNALNGDALALQKFKIKGTPTTFFIGPKGNIIGSTLSSDPNDNRFFQIANYLVNLERN